MPFPFNRDGPQPTLLRQGCCLGLKQGGRKKLKTKDRPLAMPSSSRSIRLLPGCSMPRLQSANVGLSPWVRPERRGDGEVVWGEVRQDIEAQRPYYACRHTCVPILALNTSNPPPNAPPHHPLLPLLHLPLPRPARRHPLHRPLLFPLLFDLHLSGAYTTQDARAQRCRRQSDACPGGLGRDSDRDHSGGGEQAAESAHFGGVYSAAARLCV